MEITANRIWHVARYALGGLLFVLVLCVGFFVSPLGRDFVARELLSAIGGRGSAKAGTVEGAWPGALTLRDVALTDRQGAWLTIGALTIQWRPLALLTGTLHLDQVTIDDPVLLRQPIAEQNKKSESGSSSLPVAVQLDRLVLDKGAVVTAAGARMVFSARGSARLSDARKALTLDLKRMDGPDEHAQIEALIDEAAHGIGLKVDASALDGGLFAQLLGKPSLPAFTVALNGEGPASHWSFAGEASGGGYGFLRAKGIASWTDQITVEAAGTVQPGEAVDEQWRTIIGEKADVSLHYGRDHARAQSAKLTLAAEGVRLDAQGLLSAARLIEGRTLKGTLHLETTKPIAAYGLKFAGVSLVGALDGTLSQPRLTTNLAVQELEQDGYSLSGLKGTLNAELRSLLGARAITLAGGGTLDAAHKAGSLIAEAGQWSITGKGDLNSEILQSADFAFKSAALSLAAQARDVGRGRAALGADLDAADLNALAPIIEMPAQGSGTLHITATRGAAQEPLMLQLKGALQNPVIDGWDLRALSGPALNFDAQLIRQADGPLDLKSATIQGEKINIKGGGRLLPTPDAALSVQSDLKALGTMFGIESEGGMQGRVAVKGSWQRPILAIELNGQNTIISKRKIGRLAAVFAPSLGASFPAGQLTLKTEGPLGGADLRTPIRRSAEDILIGPIAGVAYGGAVSGALKRTKGDLTGNVTADFRDISALYDLATGHAGAMDGRLKLALDLGPQSDLKLKLTGSGWDTHYDLQAYRLNVDAARAKGRLAVAATMEDVRLPGIVAPIEARRIALTLRGPEDAPSWALDADQLTGPDGALHAKGALKTGGSSSGLTMDALSGTLWSAPVALEKPVRIAFSGPSLSGLALKIGGGRLALDYQARGRGRKGSLAVSALPLSFVGRALAADWPQGQIEGHVALDSMSRRPTGFVDLTLTRAVFSRMAPAQAPPVEGRLKGDWDGRRLALDGSTLSAPNAEPGGPLLLKATLPVVFRPANGAIVLDDAGPVSGRLHWTGRLGTIWALLPFDLHRLDGEAEVDASAAGRWGAPKLDGTFRVRNGRYESVATGTRLVNITLDGKANAGGVALILAGQDTQGGTMSAKAHLMPGANGVVSADMDLAHLRIVGLDRVVAIASGPVHLTGTVSHPRIEGAIRLDRVDASIPDKLPPSIPTLPVREVGQVSRSLPPAAPLPSAQAQGIGLALDVSIPGQAFLRGRGLTSEWRGKLAVSGTTVEPRISGAIDLVKGDIAFGGTSYPLTSGRVTFAGGPKIEPRLDIETQRMVSGTEVALKLSGPADAPEIDITASPPLPRDQAMALFLFGKPAQSLTTLELLQVARSIATLSGQGGGFDPLERVRRGLGLDILTVDVDSKSGTTGGTSSIASGTTLQAGRYISRKVYLGVKQGASTGSSAVQLGYALTPHLQVGTEVGVSAGESLTLDYKWDY